jgi:predicted ribosome quality control (RQC) complex YloA/Tae2 family protein
VPLSDSTSQQSSLKDESPVCSQTGDCPFAKQKAAALVQANKELKKAEKRLSNYQEILKDCLNWEAVHHQGLLLQANLFRITKGMREMVVADWKLEGKEGSEGQDRILILQTDLPPHEQASAYFRRSKKLRKGIAHAERMLKMAEQDLQKKEEHKRLLEEATDSPTLLGSLKNMGIAGTVLQKTPLRKHKEPPKPYKIFRSAAGIEIWVGKSAKDNDRLSFHYANGRDLWLHARNHPGSHVVVRCKKDQEIDQESLYDAAELALRFSKAKNLGTDEVSLTDVKSLTRVKGTPGKVMLSKHKVLRTSLDNNRWLRLQSHS